MPELTLSQVLARIETQKRCVSAQIATIPAGEWNSRSFMDLCNRERELHSALQVLRELDAQITPRAAAAAAFC